MPCLNSLVGYSTWGVKCFATDCPCSVRCRELTCHLYVGSFLEIKVEMTVGL